jgi:hypothetical protein
MPLFCSSNENCYEVDRSGKLICEEVDSLSKVISLALAILSMAQVLTLIAVIFLAWILACAAMTSCGIHLK